MYDEEPTEAEMIAEAQERELERAERKRKSEPKKKKEPRNVFAPGAFRKDVYKGIK